MPRYAPYYVPPPSFSPSPTRPPSYRRRPRAQRRTSTNSSTDSNVSSTPSSEHGGPTYVPEHFEVILPPSPASPPAAHLNTMPFEEVPRARVTRALDGLQAVLGRAEEGISSVMGMREQQAGFLGYQERLLAQLRDEQSVVEEEVCRKKAELEAVESEIVLFSERMDKGVLRSRTNRGVGGAREGWSHTLHRTLRTMRTRSTS